MNPPNNVLNDPKRDTHFVDAPLLRVAMTRRNLLGTAATGAALAATMTLGGCSKGGPGGTVAAEAVIKPYGGPAGGWVPSAPWRLC